MARGVYVGSAGWSIPRACAGRFEGPGTHLERYGRVMNAVEINSSFHRPHAAATYARWAASTPDDFRFSVKLPRAITHDRQLSDVEGPLDRFLEETAGLGARLGPLLVQLPPSFAFEPALVDRFFTLVRERHDGPIACEPRHATWMADAATRLLTRYRVARVAADPPRMQGDDRPGAWPGLVYYRWHGAPRVYWSRYDDAQLEALAAQVRDAAGGAGVWCVFDNTASGAALENALELLDLLSRSP